MIQITLSKTGAGLSKQKAEYLDKDKKHINELIILYNKAKSTQKKEPSDKLADQIKNLRKDIAIKYDIWSRREGFEVMPCGDLGVRLRQQGYCRDMHKSDAIGMVTEEWKKMLNELKTGDSRHVGIRPFFISPDPKTMVSLDENQKKDTMNRTVKDMMKKFKDQYVERGDNFSYVYSVHMDTQVPHAHIYLFPYTKKGKYLSMNANKYLNKREREFSGKDYLENDQKVESKLKKMQVMVKNSYKKELARTMKHERKMIEQKKDFGLEKKGPRIRF